MKVKASPKPKIHRLILRIPLAIRPCSNFTCTWVLQIKHYKSMFLKGYPILMVNQGKPSQREAKGIVLSQRGVRWRRLGRQWLRWGGVTQRRGDNRNRVRRAFTGPVCNTRQSPLSIISNASILCAYVPKDVWLPGRSSMCLWKSRAMKIGRIPELKSETCSNVGYSIGTLYCVGTPARNIVHEHG